MEKKDIKPIDISGFYSFSNLPDPPSADEFSIFKRKVESLIQLDLTNYKNTQMERRIASFMHRNNISNLNDYYNLLKNDPKHLTDFKNMLTINVTEFFRNPEKFDELEKVYIPELLSKSNGIKVWSSGCSIGAEIYSMAMILDKMGVINKCTLIASDFDETAIEKAKNAVYNRAELKSMAEKYNGYFSDIPTEPEKVQFSKALASKVIFKKQDLLKSQFETGFDLIFCRNVVIYFTDEAKDSLYKKYYESLKVGGILFIGSTERINGYKEMGYKLRTSFFYQK